MGSLDKTGYGFDPASLFSQRVMRWKPGAIRSLLALEKKPGMMSLVAGKPHPSTFPLSKISMTLNDLHQTEIVLDGSVLEDALQYGSAAGHEGLVQWFCDFQMEIHRLNDNSSWTVCIGNGSQELIHRAFQVFSDRNDPVMIETPAYPGVASFLKADGNPFIEVKSDADGIDPQALERTLLDWPRNRRRPRVLYTVPTGSNPTGRSCTEARKAQILRLAKRFQFMIFEDDAYYFLNFAQPVSARARSFLSLEEEVNGETGRVLRFDSLSKVVSPGMRLAFLTGPRVAIDKVVKITENINLQPSTTTQTMVDALLRTWGVPGFLQHCHEAASFYKKKRDTFNRALERHLAGKGSWEVPTAGMFFWLTLWLPQGVDTMQLLRTKGVEAGVLAIPGVAFMPNGSQTCQLRASYSLIEESQMDEVCRRIASLVDEACKQ